MNVTVYNLKNDNLKLKDMPKEEGTKGGVVAPGPKPPKS